MEFSEHFQQETPITELQLSGRMENKVSRIIYGILGRPDNAQAGVSSQF